MMNILFHSTSSSFLPLLISLLQIFSLVTSSPSPGYPEHVHEKCIDKSQASSIHLSCLEHQKIAIHEAFFTSASRLRCPFRSYPETHESEPIKLTNEEYELVNMYPPLSSPCTDDLRFSMNRKCSGRDNCHFNLLHDHTTSCPGTDGSVIIRFSCISDQKYHPFCNLNLTDNYGYISTPGYPEFYPPSKSCSWEITGGVGQVVQIDVIDASMKEPRRVPNAKNKRKPTYDCTDKFIIAEGSNKMFIICGEDKTNLIQYRSVENKINVEFKSEDISPTRGILFRYSLQNCPSIPAPYKGHMIRNGSFAYYNCCEDHVFEDTLLSERVLYCEFGIQWNSTVSKCIPIDSANSIVFDSSFGESSASVRESMEEEESTKIEGAYVSDILIPIILMVTLLLGNAVIVWVLLRLKRKQKLRQANGESGTGLPLNANCPTDV